ncbi:CCA-adding enzyme [uncultured archaeon]|nr:CCA-adding enzyme [uncultured archaeon]
MENLLARILEKITPTQEERKKEAALIENIMREIRHAEPEGEPLLVGSLAKDTDLSGNKDIDIFVTFDPSVPRSDLEKRGLKMGKKVVKALGSEPEIDYAEHPYVKGVLEGYVVEIVPCYRGPKIQSSVDRTPYHTQHIKKKLSEKPGLREDIRLMKQLMKACGVYGAESKVEGFSGYLTELIVIHYGGFLGTVEAASNLWKYGLAIDSEKHWDKPENLKHFFPNSPLIVVDPVDKDRNVAAAVSKQKMAELMVACRDFLTKPSEESFFPKKEHPPTKEALKARIKERGTLLVAVEITHPKLNENMLYSQLRRTLVGLETHIKEFDFTIFKTDVWTDEKTKSALLLEMTVWELPQVMRVYGPPADSNKEDQLKFYEKYKAYRPYVSEGRWMTDAPRPVKTVQKAVEFALNERRGFGKNLQDAQLKTHYLEDVLKLSEDDGYKMFLGKFLRA